MAGELTITSAQVAPVEVIEQWTAPCAAAVSAGQCVRLDSTGKWTPAAATSSGAAGNRVGIAINKGSVGEAITAVLKGVVDLGPGAAMDALTNDAPIYLSDTTGSIATSAGTVSKVIGHVTAIWRTVTQNDKLLRVNG